METAQGRSKGPTNSTGQALGTGHPPRPGALCVARLAFTATEESSFNWIKGDGRAAFLRKPKLSRRSCGAFHREFSVLKF